MFTEAYMLRALMASVLLGPVCGLLGVFVTARRLAFFSDTVAHSALAGVAIGLWLGASDPHSRHACRQYRRGLPAPLAAAAD